MLSLIKMNVYQDFKSLSCILFGCLEINVIYKALKYAIIYKVKFWRLIGKAVKPETLVKLSKSFQIQRWLTSTAFVLSLMLQLQKILQYLLHFAQQNQLKVSKKIKHLEII